MTHIPTSSPAPVPRFTAEEKKMINGTCDYFSMNFYTSYYVSAPVNSIDPAMVSTILPCVTWLEV